MLWLFIDIIKKLIFLYNNLLECKTRPPIATICILNYVFISKNNLLMCIVYEMKTTNQNDAKYQIVIFFFYFKTFVAFKLVSSEILIENDSCSIN